MPKRLIVEPRDTTSLAWEQGGVTWLPTRRTGQNFKLDMLACRSGCCFHKFN